MKVDSQINRPSHTRSPDISRSQCYDFDNRLLAYGLSSSRDPKVIRISDLCDLDPKSKIGENTKIKKLKNNPKHLLQTVDSRSMVSQTCKANKGSGKKPVIK